MRRTVPPVILLTVLALMFAGPIQRALGQIVPAFPFQLQNNTVADATQVMANFNQLLNNINANAAKNGANSDITALLGLTTPLAPSVGGTTTWTGGTSTGSANAQAVATVVPSTFSLAVGSRVVFVAGFTNTGAATINVAASGAKNIYRNVLLLSSGDVGALVGGEIVAGAVVEVVYDGTQFQLVGAPVTVGRVTDYGGATAPLGWAFTDGTCISQTTYPALLAVIGTGWGTCGAGLFALLDYNGRVGVAKDNGAARITTACASGNTLAAGCGAQNQTVAQANLPNVSFNLSISDTRTFATANPLYPNNGVGPLTLGGGAATGVPATQAVVVTGGSIGGTAASGGSGTPLTTMQPSLIVNKIIKL